MRLELQHDAETAEQIRELQERDGYVSDISARCATGRTSSDGRSPSSCRR